MAELLAVAGGISSFETIAEVALHLVQGCRQLVQEAKNAPKEVHKLVEELKILIHTAEGFETIVRDTADVDLKTKVDQAVRGALERCVGVVDGLNGILAEYEKGFQKAGAKLWWEKVKAVKGKKRVSRVLDDIERAKLALVLANQNATSITMQSQGSTLGTISQSVGLIQDESLATSSKIDNLVSQGTEILTIAKSTQQHMSDSEIRGREDAERQAALQRKLEIISEAQNRTSNQIIRSVELVHDSNMSISTRIDNSFNQGEALLTITKRTDQTVSETELDALVGMFTQALNAHDTMHQQIQVEELESDIDSTVYCGNNNSVAVEQSAPNGRRRARWKQASYTQYFWNRYLRIYSTTREEIPDEDDSAQELGLPKKTETTFTIRSTLPSFKWARYSTTSSTTWDPLYETKVRYKRVFTKDSPIWKACKALDLDEVRRLFVSGEASPFMEDQFGFSLADELMDYIGDAEDKLDCFVRLVDFLIKSCGRGCAPLDSSGVGSLIYHTRRYQLSDTKNRIPHPMMQSATSILRLIVEYSCEDPLDDPNVPAFIDLDHSQDSLVTALTQQSFWPLELRPTLDTNGWVRENPRQMLDDPNGDYLRELLDPEDADEYSVRNKGPLESPFSGLFEIATQTTRDDLRECCKNRMKLLISTPKFHRLLRDETLDLEDAIDMRPRYSVSYYDRFYAGDDFYVGRLAIRRGYRPLLEEVFQELGWSDFDIDDFFDKGIFHCVPALLDGEIIYGTSQQAQQEFILNLCDGAFAEMSNDEVETLVRSIWHTVKEENLYLLDLEKIIEAANIAFISKSTPGSWPEEGKIRLVPGVDFEVYWSWKEYIFPWYCDYIDPDFEFELE